MEALKINIEKSDIPTLLNISLIINGIQYGGIIYKEKEVENDKANNIE